MLASLAAITTAVGIAACASSQRPAPVAGVLATVNDFADGLYPAGDVNGYGDLLYVTFGAPIYSVDVTDPRRPFETSGKAYPNLVCGPCPMILLSPYAALMMSHSSLAENALPASPVSNWIYDFPDPSYIAWSMALVSSQALAVGRAGQMPGNSRIDFYANDPTSGNLALVSTIPVDFNPREVVVDSASLFVATAPTNDLVSFDVGNAAAPLQRSRLAIPVAASHRVYRIAVHGHEVIATFLNLNSVNDVDTVEWLRYSSDFSSLSLVYALVGGPFFEAVPVITRNYVLLGGWTADLKETGTYVLEMTTAGTLVEHTFVPDPKADGTLAVDESRGLAYVGGNSIQILDLGYITTGVPAWPSASGAKP